MIGIKKQNKKDREDESKGLLVFWKKVRNGLAKEPSYDHRKYQGGKK